ncbi:SCO7613 C-terminal domain-containing membrane protein [Streptosporangium canum]|uniref:SCO7613 C-terminal domain-containing membrane protein n=1 Tax=Streptosporangium canum TaxID=324952 RepID=UPI0037B10933
MAIVRAHDRCPHCALPLRGPVAAELWQLDRALAGLRAREAELLVRRGRLLDLLRAERDRPAGSDPGVRPAPAGTGPHPAPAGPPASGQSAAPGQPAAPAAGQPVSPVPARPGSSVPAMPRIPVPGQPGFPVSERPGPLASGQPGPPAASPRRDFSPKAVQNLLLVLGGLLLAVAAVVFTVVSWGQIGIGGRAAILAGITVLTFAVPKLLVKRELVATAETIAVLGVALLFLDGYAARRVGLAGADRIAALDYAALLIALIALVVAGYSRLLPLRLPLPVAVVLAQFPLPLLALSETAPWFTAALAATAAADAAFLVFGHGRNKPATVPGDGGTAGPVVLGAGGLTGPAVPGGVGTAGLARVPGGAGPGRRAGVRVTVGLCFGVVWTLGVGHGSLNSSLGLMDFTRADDLFTASIKGALLIALAVIGVAVAPRTATGRLRALTAGAAFALTAGLAAPVWPLLPAGWWAVPHTVAALAVAVAALRLPGLNDPRVRSAGAASAATLAALTALPFLPAVASALLTPFNRLGSVWSSANGAAGDRWISPFPEGVVVLGLLAVASVAMGRRGHASLRPVALAVGTVAVAVAPVAFGWSRAAGLAVLLALAVTLVACLTLARRPRWAGAFTVAAGPVAALAVATALAERTTTYAALAVLLAACGLAVFTARVPWAAAAALAMAVLSATGLIWAVSVGTGWQPVREGLSLALAIGALPAGLLALRRWSVAAAVSAPHGVAGGSDAGPVPHGVAGGSAAGPVADGPVADGPAVEAVDGPAVEKAAVDGAAVEGADDPRRVTGLVLGAVLAALALLPVHAALAEILGFYRPLALPWTPLPVSGGRHPLLIVITTLVAVAAVLLSWQVAGRGGVLRAGVAAWPVALTALPVSVGLPYGLEVGLFVAGLGPSAWMAARSRTDWAWGGVAALWTASIALSWALMSRPATLVVLPVTAVIAGLTAFYGRAKAVRIAGAALATSLAGGEALAAGMALEWPARHAAFGVLAVACLAAAVAGRFRTAVFAIGAETAGYALAAVGLSLGAADLPLAALACAVAGVLMAGTALRPDRRWAGYVGTGFLLVASWLRLLASDITVVEAYTVPFSLVLLAFGWWRARSRETSSWVAYGSGLASSLLPSMIAMLAGAGWVRPLLLGAVSLTVLLAGARLRLQAPALLGGLTLAAVALHELAPWIAQVVVLVPRWVPMAAGGLLLVVVGATYEARLGDVRRLRAAVGRMR